MVAAHFDIFVVRSLEGAGSEDAKQMWDRVQAFKLLVKCMHETLVPVVVRTRS